MTQEHPNASIYAKFQERLKTEQKRAAAALRKEANLALARKVTQLIEATEQDTVVKERLSKAREAKKAKAKANSKQTRQRRTNG